MMGKPEAIEWKHCAVGKHEYVFPGCTAELSVPFQNFRCVIHSHGKRNILNIALNQNSNSNNNDTKSESDGISLLFLEPCNNPVFRIISLLNNLYSKRTLGTFVPRKEDCRLQS